ncbi:hypothetical protein LVJ94_50100 [Pendulispora rubella]|uniref:Uncharacterized protein n=1 Tax=Pendulispora rubella TaxID=2741070 RepID=A0ABZ2L3W3_9BACT
MSVSLIELQTRIGEGFLRMQALRDDIRERLNAGGMEEWVEWQKLDAEATAFELGVEEITEDLWRVLTTLLSKLSKLRDDLFDAATSPTMSRIVQLEAAPAPALY